ncbi:MAG: amino-acid N-acetyltransferase [Gammaproteobacteria bacterium]
METSGYATWFRASTPYISAHRNRTFVVLLGGEAIAHPNLPNIVHDLALLHVLGVRLVLVHGARPQIDAALPASRFHGDRRITDRDSLGAVLGVYGQLRTQLEALFSTGLPTSPLRNADIATLTGNFVVARPVGVVDGIDHLYTGQVRKVHVQRLRAALEARSLVLLSPIGYSPSGQAFNLAADELAADLALALEADKLIAFDSSGYVTDTDGATHSTLTPTALAQLIEDTARASSEQTADRPSAPRALLSALLRASQGVPKCHVVSYTQDGALLEELFTAEGHGTQVSADSGSVIRRARVDDVGGIVEVIRPLEEAGVLVRRDRDRLEQEIENFLVAEIDGIIVGCCAVYPYDDVAELACVAVHESYRQAGLRPGIGTRLLAAAEVGARAAGLHALFVLTTQTRDWFIEHGFTTAAPSALPAPRQALYNFQRNSQVLIKSLDTET